MTKLNVKMLSILQGNPYGTLLFSHLRTKGIGIEDHYPRIFFLKLVLESKTNILHLHTIHHFFQGKDESRRFLKFLIFITQIFIIRLVGIRIVWTVHEWADKFQGKWGEIYPTWAMIIGHLMDGIIAHCPSTKDDMLKALSLDSTEKIFVIPHGNYIKVYKDEISQFEARETLAINHSDIVFLLFGNIYRAKGFLEAIDAFKHLDQEKVHLVITGFPGEDDIESIIHQKIEGHQNIKFFPKKVLDDEIQLYINACDCVVVPYKTFTTSGVTLLAMSFGKACIAPRLGYFNDVLDEKGSFLYDPENYDGLACSMQMALDKGSCLERMGQHNLSKVMKWDWNYVADETLKVYESCINR
jgi:beta-1,4-mannosyltransferase